MRGIPSSVTTIRKKVFTEVARLAYDGDYDRMEKLPYIIVPGEEAKYRESIFLERAIAGERVRLAMGLPLRPVDQHTLLSEGINESAIADKYYDPPLINIIQYACHACPTRQYRVTEYCQGCLAHSCQQACPKDAIRFVNGKSYIRQDACIKCGRCAEACQYNAIIKLERPCAKACGVGAISADERGRAKIDYDKCVSCGMCLVNCPFGAIVDKGQIFQLIHSLKRGDRVVAIVAPAFLGQFGPEATPERLTPAMKRLGFADVVEVAVGADLCTIQEAEDFLKEVPEKLPFMATSCCPSWSVMAKPPWSSPPGSRRRRTRAAGFALWAPAPPKSWRPAAAPSAATWTSSSPLRSSRACSRPRRWTSPPFPRRRRSPSANPPGRDVASPSPAAWPGQWWRPSTAWTPTGR